MQLQCTLHEAELNEAIHSYMIAKGYPVEGMESSINLIKGRSEAGTRAEVIFVQKGSLPEQVSTPRPEWQAPVENEKIEVEEPVEMTEVEEAKSLFG